MGRDQVRAKRPRTVGHASHEAIVRVDRRARQMLARREAELRQVRRAAQRLKGR